MKDSPVCSARALTRPASFLALPIAEQSITSAGLHDDQPTLEMNEAGWIGHPLFLLFQNTTEQALLAAARWTSNGDEGARVFGQPPLDALFRFYTIAPRVLAGGVIVGRFVRSRRGAAEKGE